MAQPSNAGRAVIKVNTYSADGKLIGNSQGFFIDEEGTAVAPYHIFENAAKAEVVNSKGKLLNVHRIIGANSTYDIVKFSVETKGKTDFLPTITDSTHTANNGDELFLINYSTNKKEKPASIRVNKTDVFSSYRYYQVTAANKETTFGCPLVNNNGEVVAIVQQNATSQSDNACALDIRFVENLQVKVQNALNSDLRKTAIPKAIPTIREEALSYIFLLNAADTASLSTALDDYVTAFPNSAEGYTNRANYLASHNRFNESESDYRKALQLNDTTYTPDAVHFSFSKAILQAFERNAAAPQPAWNVNEATRHAREAYEINPQSVYLQQEAYALFASKQYEKAYQCFLQLNKTALATPATWFAAVRAFELSDKNNDSLTVLALMDSTVQKMTVPYQPSEAQYFIEYASRAMKAGQHRKAVTAYNHYEQAIGPKNLTDAFYFLREQAELKAHMYQQALDDIHSAKTRSAGQNEEFYKTEEALIYLLSGEFDQAIKIADELIILNPDNADAHKIEGIALAEKGMTAKAKEHFNKAQALGDTESKNIAQRYNITVSD